MVACHERQLLSGHHAYLLAFWGRSIVGVAALGRPQDWEDVLIVLWCVQDGADAIFEQYGPGWLRKHSTSRTLTRIKWLKQLG